MLLSENTACALSRFDFSHLQMCKATHSNEDFMHDHEFLRYRADIRAVQDAYLVSRQDKQQITDRLLLPSWGWCSLHVTITAQSSFKYT